VRGSGGYDVGDDSGILKIIGSANIALVSRRRPGSLRPGSTLKLKLAWVTIVSIGLQRSLGVWSPHVSTRDRTIRSMVAYQNRSAARRWRPFPRQGEVCDASQARTAALNTNMADEERAASMRMAIGEPSRRGFTLITVALAGSELAKSRPQVGLRSRWKGFVTGNDDDVNLTSRKVPVRFLKF